MTVSYDGGGSIVQGGGVEGRDESGSAGTLLTDSSDISRRIRSNLLERRRETSSERVREGGALWWLVSTWLKQLGQWGSNSGSTLVNSQDTHFTPL